MTSRRLHAVGPQPIEDGECSWPQDDELKEIASGESLSKHFISLAKVRACNKDGWRYVWVN